MTSGRLTRIRAAVAALLLGLCSCAAATEDGDAAATAQAGTVEHRGDFETGDTSQFSGLECPHPDTQFRIVTEPTRQGRYAARFQEGPGDNWVAGDGSIRCLAANYDSGESQGDDYYFGFSLYFPQVPSSSLLWELHARREIYSIDPNTAVSPHAVYVENGRLMYRLLTGPAVWNGQDWTGWSHYEPQLELLPSLPVGRWVDLVIHIRFSHSPDGVVEVWTRTEGEAWPARPQVSRPGIATLPWVPGYDNRIWGGPNDPDVPDDVFTSSLYTELGIYKGGSRTSATDVVYHDGYRRGTSFAAVLEEFPP
jgi:hypothetical protein